MFNSKPPINSIHGGPPPDAQPTPYTPAMQARIDLIDLLKSAYVREKRRWLLFHKGREVDYQLPDRFENCWGKLAALIEQYNFPPVAYISAQFAKGGRPPYPSQLYSGQAIERYRLLAADHREHVADRLKSETRVFSVEVTALQMSFPTLPLRNHWCRVLSDTNLQLSPLFRYCVGESVGCHEACAEFGQLALDQYLTAAEAYDEHWATMIPPILRQAAQSALKGVEHEHERAGRHGGRQDHDRDHVWPPVAT